MLLALDTSTRLASIALYSGERGLISEYTWHSSNQHTVELMPAIARMLAQAKMAPADLLAVAVALGPGSFTGLRVALAAGKGLAVARNLALLGVPTLDVIAYPHRKAKCMKRGQPLPVIALLQAGRGRVCWASYTEEVEGPAVPTPYALDTLAGLMESITYPALFAGELESADRARLAEHIVVGSRVASPALASGRAGYLAEIAWGRFAAGGRDDPATLNPIYLARQGTPGLTPALERGALPSQALGKGGKV